MRRMKDKIEGSITYADSAGNGTDSSGSHFGDNPTGDGGYVRFCNGVQICWSIMNSGNASGVCTFHESFKYNPCVMISGTGAYRYAFYVTKLSTTSFSYYRDGSGTTARPQYVAIGFWK